MAKILYADSLYSEGVIDTILHIGIEHPRVLWILISSFLSYLTGLRFGIHSDRLQEWLRPQNAEAAN